MTADPAQRPHDPQRNYSESRSDISPEQEQLGEARMDLICSTSAFANETLEAALDGVRQMGFAEIDLLVIDGWAHVNTTDLADDWDGTVARVDALLNENGLRPLGFNVGFSGLLHDRLPEARAQRLREADALGRFAEHYGVIVCGLQPSLKYTEKSVEQVFEESIASVREVANAVESAGLTVALECHARSAFETLEYALRLRDEAPWLSIAYDPSHLVMAGIDVRDSLPLLQHAAHVHLRDAAPGRMQAPPGEGAVDFAWIIANLKDCGYEGNISIECLPGKETDVRDHVRRLRDIIEPLIQ